jgi:CBS domain-containing protein
MRKEVHTTDVETTIAEAAKIMANDEYYEGYVIILKKGKPQGILTERDIINKVLSQELNPNDTKVVDVMSSPLVTIGPDEDLSKAAQIMSEHNIRKLVVIKDNIIYGIITSKGISQHFQDYVDNSVRDIIRWTASIGI